MEKEDNAQNYQWDRFKFIANFSSSELCKIAYALHSFPFVGSAGVYGKSSTA